MILSALVCSTSLYAAAGIDALSDADFKTLYADPDNATCVWFYGKDGYDAKYDAKYNGGSQQVLDAMKGYCFAAQATLPENAQKIGMSKGVLQTATLKYNQPQWRQR